MTNLPLGRSSRKADPRLPSQEDLLLDLARSLRRHQTGRRAVHIHFSRLNRANLSQHDLRSAAEFFSPLVRSHEGRLFRLFNQDMVMVTTGVSFARLDEIILRIRAILRDNPDYKRLDSLTRSPEGSDAFCTFYDMETESELFFATVVGFCETKGQGQSQAQIPAQIQTMSGALGAEPTSLPEPPTSGSTFGSGLAPAAKGPETAPKQQPQTSEADILHRHLVTTTIMALTRDGHRTPIMTTVQVQIESLKVDVRPLWRSYSNERWLLKVLPQLMNEDTIARFISPKSLPAVFILPANMDSIDSQEFQDFVTAYRRLTSGSILFEFQATEILARPAQFLNIRDRIIEQGHKLCVTGWDPHLFALISVHLLDVHFNKITWHPSYLTGFRADLGEHLGESIRRIGSTKVVLADCSSADAIQFGQRHGLLLYQGAHVDSLTQAL